MRLIDADAAVKLIQIATAKELYEGELTKRLGNSYNYHAIAAGYKAAIDDMTQAVKDVPVIDAVPVVHGLWVHDINNLYGCSECMKRETMSPKKLKPYCPHCGAKMDGEAK